MSDKTRKRLHIGGLASSITETDLRERLGKFGDINSVDIKVKKDETGQPFKTFAYIDISITDKSLQHCIRVYHNTKWKGSTLEIQLAKENFLDRLRKEQMSKQNVDTPTSSSKAIVKPGDKNLSDCSPGRYNNGGNVENSLENPIAMRPRKKDGKFVTAGLKNVKKYADEADMTDRSVTNLTWCLGNSSDTDVRDTPKLHHMPSPLKQKEHKRYPVSAEKHQLVKPMRAESQNSGRNLNSNRAKENSKRRRNSDQTSDRYNNFAADLVDIAITSTPHIGVKTSKDKVENISSDFLTEPSNTGAKEDGYESADSACTDEIISSSRKNPPKRLDNCDVYDNFFGAYSEGVESFRGEGYWSDEDVFDMLESGKVSELRKMQDCAEKKNRSKLKPERADLSEKKTSKSVKINPSSHDHTADESEADNKNSFRSVLEKLWTDKEKSKNNAKQSMPDAERNLSDSTSCQNDGSGSRHNLSKGDFMDSERKKEKHSLSNLKRLESLKQRQKETSAQKLAVQQALASVDKQPSNKKIVFDSDSEEERCKESLESTRKDFTKADLDTKDGSKKGEIGSISQAKDSKSKPSLFDSGDESEDESDGDQEAFRHRPQFEGAAGSKLFRLQAKFGNDRRFKMDERFIDDEESDDMANDIEKDSRPEAQEDPLGQDQSEKQKAMEILKDVLGSKGILDRKQGMKKTFRDINDLHYDPNREDHSQFEIEEKKQPVKKTKIKKTETEEETKEEILPEVSKERFFEVATSLKSAFKKQEKEPFSLLSAFGSVEEETPTNAEAVPVPIKKTTSFGWQDNLDYDSSDEEGQTSDKRKKSEETSNEKISNVIVFPAEKETFFFVENDQRIKEGISFFHRTEDMAVIREKWLEERPHLVDAYRMKHKRVLRTRKSLSKQAKRGRRT